MHPTIPVGSPHEEPYREGVHVGAHLPAVITWSPDAVTKDIVAKTNATTPGFRTLQLVSGLLFVVGIIGVALRIMGGYADASKWGYYAATVAFLLFTVGTAPLVSVATRLAKAHWRRTLARAAELYFFVSILLFLMWLPMLGLVPSASGPGPENRNTMWMGWPSPNAPAIVQALAPHILDVLFWGVVLIGGLAILVYSSGADWARPTAKGRWGKWIWARRAQPISWKALVFRLGLLGGLWFIGIIWTHSILSMDFLIALVPGWKDSIFPAQHALVGLQGGIATTMLTMYVLRRWGGYKDYFGMDQFWSLSKIMLATTLLWFYFWWSEFIVFWYGRVPLERNLIQLIMFGPYLWAFVAAFAFSFVIPFLMLIWNPVRKSVKGPTIAACFILIGAMFNAIRLYVGPYSVHNFERVKEWPMPVAHMPDIIDLMVFVGALGGVVFLYTVAMKTFGAVSQWEVRELLTLRRVRKYLGVHVLVLAKPE